MIKLKPKSMKRLTFHSCLMNNLPIDVRLGKSLQLRLHEQVSARGTADYSEMPMIFSGTGYLDKTSTNFFYGIPQGMNIKVA